MREHRLYQADWLMRFYGFSQPEIFAGSATGMLDLEIDPKLAWALRNRGAFPVDVNRASREALLRIPGLGVKVVARMIGTRRLRRLRLEDVGLLCRSIAKVRPFIVAEGWSPGRSHRRPSPARPAARRAAAVEPVRDGRPAATPVSAERVVRLAHETDFAGWRDAARALAMAGIAAASIAWQAASNAQESLLAATEELPAPAPNAASLAVPRAFIERAETVICHSRPRALRPAVPHAAAICGSEPRAARDRLRPERAPSRSHGKGGASRQPQDACLRPLPEDRLRGRRNTTSPGSSRITSSSSAMPGSSCGASPACAGRS